MPPHFECACDQCVSACRRKPGWFKPGELEKAAALLGLTPQEFFDKHAAVDWWENWNEADTQLLAPSLAHAHAGGMYPENPTGRCSLLDENDRCMIHEAKPYECAQLSHDDTVDEISTRHAAVARTWRDQQSRVRLFLYGDSK